MNLLLGRLAAALAADLHTSVTLQGAYETDAEPRPAHGYSKDHRPDLKQLIYGLTLHGPTGIPLVSTISAGNTSDPAVARDHLARLVEVLPDQHEVNFVGDCKLVDARTVGRLLRAGLHFLSLVPDTFNVRQALIREAWALRPEPDDWPLLAEKKGRKKDDPVTTYRGMSFVLPFKTMLETREGDGPASMEDLRFLVVWSDDLARGFDDSLEPKLARDADKLQQAAKRANGRGFACEADARAAAERVACKAEFHRVDIVLTSEDIPIKRAGPGRPRKDEVRETRALWRFELAVERDDDVIAATRRRRSCFVLVTDWHVDDWDDARVLAEYRHQHLVSSSRRPNASAPWVSSSSSRSWFATTSRRPSAPSSPPAARPWRTPLPRRRRPASRRRWRSSTSEAFSRRLSPSASTRDGCRSASRSP